MRDPEGLIIAGALFQDMALPDNSVQIARKPEGAEVMLIFPLGAGRYRTYFVFRHGARAPLSGAKATAEFMSCCIGTGAPSEWFRNATLKGPIASFGGAESGVEQPYRDGVALIGDAAATSDPAFGCGLSLTLRDVRVLRDHLLADGDWDAAATAYATDHDLYYAALHRIEGWWREML